MSQPIQELRNNVFLVFSKEIVLFQISQYIAYYSCMKPGGRVYILTSCKLSQIFFFIFFMLNWESPFSVRLHKLRNSFLIWNINKQKKDSLSPQTIFYYLGKIIINELNKHGNINHIQCVNWTYQKPYMLSLKAGKPF